MLKRDEEKIDYWKRPKRSKKWRPGVEFLWAWFILVFALLFLVFYPIAKKVGYWTSSLPAAILLSIPIVALIYLSRRQYKEE